jgi:hypothetical protein
LGGGELDALERVERTTGWNPSDFGIFLDEVDKAGLLLVIVVFVDVFESGVAC